MRVRQQGNGAHAMHQVSGRRAYLRLVKFLFAFMLSSKIQLIRKQIGGGKEIYFLFY